MQKQKKHYCEKCDREFNSAEPLLMHNKSKHPELVKGPFFTEKRKKIMMKLAIAVVIIVALGFAFNAMANIKVLPPTTMQGHVEAAPPTHVLKQPMPLEVQKHMLEHVDGINGNDGAVIINYDCITYECDQTLIENLEAFADEFDFIYVAPYENMKKKIVLTRLNELQTYDEYNEEVIRAFIG